MARKVLGVVVGLMAWFAAQVAFEWFKGVHPPTVLVQELATHIVGVAVAAALATKVAGWTTALPAMALGGALMIVNLLYLLAVPHPMWFEVLDLLVYVPTALLAARAVLPKSAADAPAA